MSDVAPNGEAERGRLPRPLRRSRGKFHLPEAVKRTRFDLGVRLLLAHATQEEMAAAMGITERQVRRLLRDPEFNAYADQFRKALLGAVDKAIFGRILEMLPTATEVYWKAMRDYLANKGGGEIARKTADRVFDQAGIRPPKAADADARLTPAQEEALASVTRRWMELSGVLPPSPVAQALRESIKERPAIDAGRSGEAPGPDGPSDPQH